MDNVSKSQKLFFLPVYFVNLDPADIPTSAQLDSMQPETRTCLARAMVALDGIFNIREPPIEVGPTVWPRFWAWTYFMATHWDHMPPSELFPEDTFYIEFLRYAGIFHDHSPTYDLMEATPGFRIMLAKVWARVPRLTKSLYFEIVLNDLSGFLIHCGAATPAHLAEILEGSEGTIDDLAQLIVKCMNLMVRRKAMLPHGDAYYIRALLAFVESADILSGEEAKIRPRPLGALSRTLLRHEFVEALIRAMQFLTTTSSPGTGTALRSCFRILRRIVETFRGHIWLEGAVTAGLLRVILEPALAEISTDDLEDTEIFDDWTDFEALGYDRCDILNGLDSTEDTPLKACDNTKCGRILPKSEFKRCAGCKSAYYCARYCQTADWKAGRHRKACLTEQLLTLTESAVAGSLFHEREFLRWLIQHDYEEDRVFICAEQVKCMATNPGDGPLVTLFDYTVNPTKISVQSVATSPVAAVLQKAGTEWTDILARIAASDGRMQLHIMRVLQGNNTRYWVVPLRTNSSILQTKLSRLAGSLPSAASDAELSVEIEAILDEEDEDGLVEIH
ncbi:hypothetical protein FB451DRAFT_1411220 [Mycena latifolia]|nr:hypothetical protein FB451DRAFT_1411220 [Mycena latifolia]